MSSTEPLLNGFRKFLELYYDKERLLANGDGWEQEIARNIALDSPYR